MTTELDQRILDILEPEPLAIHEIWDILQVPWGFLTSSLANLQRDSRVRIKPLPNGCVCTKVQMQRVPEPQLERGCPFDEGLF